MNLEPRVIRLVHVAYDARRWFESRICGLAANGPQDDIFILRQLDALLDEFAGDVPPVSDRDRQRFSADARAARDRRELARECEARR